MTAHHDDLPSMEPGSGATSLSRRDEILALARGELVRSHRRRRARRCALGATAVLAIAVAGSITLIPPRPTPETSWRSHQTPLASASAPSATEPPAMQGRIELVLGATPSDGFAEIIDDSGLELSLRRLSSPTGVAVIAGRTILVSNPEATGGEQIR